MSPPGSAPWLSEFSLLEYPLRTSSPVQIPAAAAATSFRPLRSPHPALASIPARPSSIPVPVPSRHLVQDSETALPDCAADYSALRLFARCTPGSTPRPPLEGF